MEKSDLQLLTRVFQDAQVGMLSIDKVLKKLEDEKLKNLFKKHKISNIKFEDITEVIIIDKWNKFINDDPTTQL